MMRMLLPQASCRGSGRRLAAIAGGLLALVAGGGIAHAQTSLSGDDRQPATIAAGSPAAARLDARMTQLEQDLRGVTGRVENLTFQMRQLNDRMEKLASDLEVRFGELRTGGAASGSAGAVAGGTSAGASAGAPGSGPTMLGRSATEGPTAAAQSPAIPAPAQQSATTPAPAAAGGLPSGSSREQYAQAFSLMQKASYAEATAAFAEFLRRYPDDPLADNARYWLGESYYARGEYTRAAEAFLEGYERNKTGPKAADTLLKLGMALAALDKKKEACASFRELTRAFPNAAAPIRDRAAQESARVGCP
jgi:tol-pal system protein YbgF